jgi:hypothetical protein
LMFLDFGYEFMVCIWGFDFFFFLFLFYVLVSE